MGCSRQGMVWYGMGALRSKPGEGSMAALTALVSTVTGAAVVRLVRRKQPPAPGHALCAELTYTNALQPAVLLHSCAHASALAADGPPQPPAPASAACAKYTPGQAT